MKTITCDEAKNCYYDIMSDSKESLPDDLLPMQPTKQKAIRKRRSKKVQIGHGRRKRASLHLTLGKRRRQKRTCKKLKRKKKATRRRRR